jgi:hypothetical protein
MRFLSLILALMLTGCGTTIKWEPPKEWLQDCPHPARQVRLNKDLALLVEDYKEALDQCNIDKQSLRKYSQ